MDEAAWHGHLDIVQYLRAKRTEGCTTTTFAIYRAATLGHLDVVKCLYEHRSEGCITRAIDGAAAFGHLEVIKWLGDHLFMGWTDAVENAARRHDSTLLEWLYAQWDARSCALNSEKVAAELGNLEALECFFAHYSDHMQRNVDNLRENALRWDRWYAYEWLGDV